MLQQYFINTTKTTIFKYQKSSQTFCLQPSCFRAAERYRTHCCCVHTRSLVDNRMSRRRHKCLKLAKAKRREHTSFETRSPGEIQLPEKRNLTTSTTRRYPSPLRFMWQRVLHANCRRVHSLLDLTALQCLLGSWTFCWDNRFEICGRNCGQELTSSINCARQAVFEPVWPQAKPKEKWIRN